MKKIVIVMTYFDRLFQIKRTIRTIQNSRYPNYDIVIVDDCSPEPLKIPGYNVIRTENKQWSNPEPAYNTGIKKALSLGADIIVLQNAENYHVGDVLSYASRVTDENYIVFPCYSINKETTFRDHDVELIIEGNNKGASRDGENAWYHHPVYRPVYYDFCSAITAKNIRLLNGYDERFSDGCGYGDDYLLARIKAIGLKIETPLSPFVVHQWHYSGEPLPDKGARIERNKRLFHELSDIKAKHIYTPDL